MLRPSFYGNNYEMLKKTIAFFILLEENPIACERKQL